MSKAANNYTVRFSDKALMQYKKAAAWYRERSVSAEENFIASVEERTRKLKHDPYRYRNEHKRFYEVSVKKYPYLLIYLIDEKHQQVLIFSVHHHKQNPKRKYR